MDIKNRLRDGIDKAKKKAGSINKESLQDTVNKARGMTSSSPEQLKKYANKKYIGWACAILVVLLGGYWFFGGASSDVKNVQNSVAFSNANINLGQAFDRYKYLTNKKWGTVKKDGENWTSLTAKYTPALLLDGSVIPQLFAYKQGEVDPNREGFKEFIKWMEGENPNVTFEALFHYDKSEHKVDNIQMYMEYQGKRTTLDDPRARLNAIFSDSTFGNSIPYSNEALREALGKQITYKLFKFFLTKNSYTEPIKFITGLSSQATNKNNESDETPDHYVLVSIKKFDFNDDKEEITCQTDISAISNATYNKSLEQGAYQKVFPIDYFEKYDVAFTEPQNFVCEYNERQLGLNLGEGHIGLGITQFLDMNFRSQNGSYFDLKPVIHPFLNTLADSSILIPNSLNLAIGNICEIILPPSEKLNNLPATSVIK